MLKKTKLKKYSKKGLENKIKKTENTKKLHEWFKELWKQRAHYSEVSGKFLGHEANTMFFHHIYPKSRYPELEFSASNIIFLTPDEHVNVENDPNIYEEINIRKKEIQEHNYYE